MSAALLQGAPTSSDLFDVTQGTRVTAGSLPSIAAPWLGMFGVNGHANISESEYTYFGDFRPAGTVHFIEWTIAAPSKLGRVRLFAAGDGPGYLNQREFATFTLKAKSPGSATFDQTLLSYSPTHPYTFVDGPSALLLDATIETVEAQEFRAEFLQYTSGRGFDGPRIIELDGFPPEDAPLIRDHPQSATVRAGSPLLLSLTPNPVATLTFQWKRDGKVLEGAILNPLRIPAATPSDAGEYTVEVSDGTRTEVSNPATVAVLPPIAQSAQDLWDVFKGSTILTTTGTRPPGTPASMFGALGHENLSQAEYTYFSDFQPPGTIHAIEWRALAPMILERFVLFAGGDGVQYYNQREFKRFTLLAKSPGSTVFDQTVFTFEPAHPYPLEDPVTLALVEKTVPPVTAQDFRAEFLQFDSGWGYEGPRVVELDGFGEYVPGAPIITEQPQSVSKNVGESVQFSVTASGPGELSYRWKRNGETIEGARARTLLISSAQAADKGQYTVEISNAAATTVSAPALLDLVDSLPPVLKLEGDSTTTTQTPRVVLRGTASDNVGVVRVFWQKAGLAGGDLTLADGKFATPEIPLTLGLNEIRIVALDGAGNRGEAVARITLEPARSVVVGGVQGAREGTRFSVPITLRRGQGAAGLSFDLIYNPEYLADPQWQWASDALQSGGQVNATKAGLIRAAWASAAGTLPTGDTILAQVSFRVRSLSRTRLLALDPALPGIYGADGSALPGLTELISGKVQAVVRTKLGDNNGNDRLDVGDAAIILRFITGLDPIRPHDIPANDLNGNALLDAGDAVKVLRAAAVAPMPGLLSALALDPAEMSGPRLMVAAPASARPGERIKVRLDLTGHQGPLAGLSFAFRYPPEALRLESVDDLQLGPIIPAEAMRIWRVEPEAAELSQQNGEIAFAAGSALPWPLANGTVAEMTFTVQDAAASRAAWTLAASQAELTDGWDVIGAGEGSAVFATRAPQAASLAASLRAGTLELQITSEPGTRWQVQASTDLISWTTVDTLTTTASGTASFTDPSAASGPHRFYRAIEHD